MSRTDGRFLVMTCVSAPDNFGSRPRFNAFRTRREQRRYLKANPETPYLWHLAVRSGPWASKDYIPSFRRKAGRRQFPK